MASDVEICNAALIKLGADRITALTDNNDRARVMNARYADVRDAELRRNRWRFAIKRTTLAALSSAPSFGYTRQFQLPVDYLSLIMIGEYDVSTDLSDYRSAPTDLFSVEAGVLLTDFAAPLKIRYIYQVTDVALMDPAFREALACRLAMETCERLTQSNSKRELATREYGMSVREAIRANAIEKGPSYPTEDSWVSTRQG